MTGLWKTKKTPEQPSRPVETQRSGFPRFPQSLGNSRAIPTFPQAPTTTIPSLQRGHFYWANQGDISIGPCIPLPDLRK